jgi:hypothetical protein
MLPASELAQLRSDILITLPDTCAILAGTAVANGMGGQDVTWGTATASVACRHDQKQGREQLAGGGVNWYTVDMFSLPYDATVAVGNRIVHAGTTYTVTNVNTGASLLAVKRVTAERV